MIVSGFISQIPLLVVIDRTVIHNRSFVAPADPPIPARTTGSIAIGAHAPDTGNRQAQPLYRGHHRVAIIAITTPGRLLCVSIKRCQKVYVH